MVGGGQQLGRGAKCGGVRASGGVATGRAVEDIGLTQGQHSVLLEQGDGLVQAGHNVTRIGCTRGRVRQHNTQGG